jgi:hypothetical protein
MRYLTDSKPKEAAVICPYCKESIEYVMAVRCSVCSTWHHKVCWNENEKCAIYGCLGTQKEILPRKPDWRIDLLFGIILIAFWLLLSWAGFEVGPVTEVRDGIIMGSYIYFWAGLFLASYFWRDASWLLRGLMWVCENLSAPRGAWTAFLWASLAFILGTISIIQGLRLI